MSVKHVCIDWTTKFLWRSSTIRTALESYRLAELNYAISAVWDVRKIPFSKGQIRKKNFSLRTCCGVNHVYHSWKCRLTSRKESERPAQKLGFSWKETEQWPTKGKAALAGESQSCQRTLASRANTAVVQSGKNEIKNSSTNQKAKNEWHICIQVPWWDNNGKRQRLWESWLKGKKCWATCAKHENHS